MTLGTAAAQWQVPRMDRFVFSLHNLHLSSWIVSSNCVSCILILMESLGNIPHDAGEWNRLGSMAIRWRQWPNLSGE